jgi:hypothetical protein
MPNYDIVTIALSLLPNNTGASLEDIALECHRLIPSRFCWTQNPDIPDLDAPRVSLTDARKEKNGAKVESHVPVTGRRKFAWRLTASGREWINEHDDLVQYLHQTFPQPMDYASREPSDLLTAVLQALPDSDDMTIVDVTREALRRFPAAFSVGGVRTWPDFRKVEHALKAVGVTTATDGRVKVPAAIRSAQRKSTSVNATSPSAIRARDERLKYLQHITNSQLYKRFASATTRANPTRGELCSLLLAPMNSSEADLDEALAELEGRVHGVGSENLQPLFAWLHRAIRDLDS